MVDVTYRSETEARKESIVDETYTFITLSRISKAANKRDENNQKLETFQIQIWDVPYVRSGNVTLAPIGDSS